MTEPFQVFGSALTTIEVALKLYRSLSTFVVKAQNAPKTAKGLVADAQRLRGTLYMVQLTLQVREYQLKSEEPTTAERYIWRNIRESLCSWKQTLRHFKKEMNGLTVGAEGQHMSWVDKCLWQLRHGRKDPTLQSLQRSMMDCIAQLSLSMHCLNLLMHTPTQRERDKELLNIDHDVEQAEELNHSPLVAGDLSNSSDCIQRNEQDRRRMNNCIIAARATKNLVEKTSTAEKESELSPVNSILKEGEWEDTVDENEDEGDDDEDKTAESAVPQSSIIDNFEDDPDPTFDDTIPREPLRKIIKYYLKEVPMSLQDTESLERAEYLQRRLIKHAEDWNQAYEPPMDMTNMHLKLSEILGMQKNDRTKIDDGVRNLLENFPGPREPLAARRHSESSLDPRTRVEQASFYHVLAQLQLIQYHDTQGNKNFLDLAEKWAQRCFKLRLEFRDDPNSKFSESVHELIEVIRLQKHSAEANIYHDLFLGVESSEAPMLEQPPRSPSSGPAATTPSFLSTIISPWQHIDDHDSLGLTPLICAIDQMDASKVDLLIDNGADVEVRDLDDKTPLLHAACKEDESMIVKLKNAGAGMDTICKGLTVLHHMICAGKARMVRVLLENGAKIDFPGPNGSTPLLHAVLRDKVEKQNATDLERRNVTHALTGNCFLEPEAQASVVQALCYREPGDSLQKPKIDTRDNEGWTVLHHAIHNGRYEVLEVLLANGADPNIGCRVGKTPLHHAVDRKQYRSAELLLRSGANVNAKDSHDRTSLLSAVRATNTYQLIELLLDNEATVEWNKFDKPLNKDVKDLLKSGTERRGSMNSARTSSSSRSWYTLSTITGRNR